MLHFKKRSRVTIMLATMFVMTLTIGFAGNQIGDAHTLPESVSLSGQELPLYPDGQTYGVHLPNIPPDLIAAYGIDDIEGYVYQADLDGEQPENPEEALEYMKRLHERKEEMRITGEKYSRIIPLYSEDGVTVIGAFGIS